MLIVTFVTCNIFVIAFVYHVIVAIILANCRVILVALLSWQHDCFFKLR